MLAHGWGGRDTHFLILANNGYRSKPGRRFATALEMARAATNNADGPGPPGRDTIAGGIPPSKLPQGGTKKQKNWRPGCTASGCPGFKIPSPAGQEGIDPSSSRGQNGPSFYPKYKYFQYFLDIDSVQI